MSTQNHSVAPRARIRHSRAGGNPAKPRLWQRKELDPDFHRDDPARNGFTLIELSIVLVIIGLVIGGVLVGRDLINGAQIRSQISQTDHIKIAITTFKLKYNCIPGDCANAVNLGLGSSSGPGENGDNDGMVRIITPSWFFHKESVNLWYHLSQAKLIQEDYLGWPNNTAPSSLRGYVPAAKLDNLILNVISYTEANFTENVIQIFRQTNFGEYFDGMKPSDAFGIDSKLDDGMPCTGSVRVMQASSQPLYNNCSWSQNRCGDSTWPAIENRKYNTLSSNSSLCTIGITKAF